MADCSDIAALSTTDIVRAIAELDSADLPAIAMALAARLAAVRQAPAPEPGDRLLLTVAEAAERLGYKQSYLYELVRRGEIDVIRSGRLVRIRQSAVNAYMAQNERRGTLPLKIAANMGKA